jgi:hypothetical protein
MKIRFSQEGGFAHFPGLEQAFEVNTDHLEPDEARALQDCLERAKFFELPETTPRVVPDARVYTISVTDDGRSKTVRLSDPLEDEHLETLLNVLRGMKR